VVVASLNRGHRIVVAAGRVKAHQIVAVGIDVVRHQPRLRGHVGRCCLDEEVDRERHDVFDHSRDSDVADIP
jgi:hypothetical protein